MISWRLTELQRLMELQVDPLERAETPSISFPLEFFLRVFGELLILIILEPGGTFERDARGTGIIGVDVDIK